MDIPSDGTGTPSPTSSPSSSGSVLGYADASTLEALRELCRRDLYIFLKFVLGFDQLVPQVHGPLCRALQNPSLRSIKVTFPRGWFKTTVCSIGYPIWESIRNPNISILIAQNTYRNAQAKLGSIRQLWEQRPLLRALFPELLPDADCFWSSDKLQLRRTVSRPEATYECAGIGTNVISRHYDIIIEDDTVAPDLDELGADNLVPTKDDIEQAIGWHRLLPPLFVDVSKGRNIVVGTRWFELDLLSWIDQNEKTFFSIERAVREDLKTGLPSVEGAIVWPERFNAETLAKLEASMGPYLYSCLYMNKPLRSSDMLFKDQWFQYYDREPNNLMIYTTVDLAGDPEKQKNKDPDYSVVLTAGKSIYSGNIYILDYFQKKCHPNETINAIFDHVRKWSPVKVGVEKIGQDTLTSLMEDRKRREKLYFVVEGLTHGGRSKNARILGLQPLFADGKIFMRVTHTGLRSELLAFPFGKHDDVIDALSMQIPLWQVIRSQDNKPWRAKYDPASPEFAIAEAEEATRRHEAGLIYDVIGGSPFTQAEKQNVWNANPRQVA